MQVDKRSPREALEAEREFALLMEKVRGGGKEFEPIPGTRKEVEAIAGTFRESGIEVDMLLGRVAREEKLRELLKSGELSKYRYLHFATHGVPSADRAFDSALILSQDNLPDPLEAVLKGEEAVDGKLTAAEILRTWKLEADLVVLSACQTALGRHAGGEGHLGFSQALLLSGARSVVLSLWKVDDRPTALLMTRFYENLLGKRSGLRGPLPKSEALAEAQSWLRELKRSDLDHLLERPPEDARGAERPLKGSAPKGKPKREPEKKPDEERPYADPYFWATFILVGDYE